MKLRGPVEGFKVPLRWIEFRPRPKKDGLHDSGYRFIELVGVDAKGERWDLGAWHDLLDVEAPCSIDVTADGTIRFMPRKEQFWYDGRTLWVSSANIDPDGRVR